MSCSYHDQSVLNHFRHHEFAGVEKSSNRAHFKRVSESRLWGVKLMLSSVKLNLGEFFAIMLDMRMMRIIMHKYVKPMKMLIEDD